MIVDDKKSDNRCVLRWAPFPQDIRTGTLERPVPPRPGANRRLAANAPHAPHDRVAYAVAVVGDESGSEAPWSLTKASTTLTRTSAYGDPGGAPCRTAFGHSARGRDEESSRTGPHVTDDDRADGRRGGFFNAGDRLGDRGLEGVGGLGFGRPV